MRPRTLPLALGAAATAALFTGVSALTATAAETRPAKPLTAAAGMAPAKPLTAVAGLPVAGPHTAAGLPATDSHAAGGAPPAEPFVVANACPTVAPPKATCFAKVVVSGGATATTRAAPAGFGPADLVSAYRIPSGGSGQVVGIVDAYGDPNLEADLAAYRSAYSLPPCTTANGCLRIVNQAGASSPLPTPDAGWALETSLDVDMASAVCPVCGILVVQADSNGLEPLGTAVDTAVRLGAAVVSNSYGTGVEFSGQAALEQHYVHPGHPIVVSSGDIGYSASFPAASAHVTSVGGTTLTRSASGAWSESVWSGTGSGCSAYMAKPSWQTDPHCPMRMLNDVSAVADPATGVAVYDTYQSTGWRVVGGTSASAPIIAAMYALTGAADRIDDGSVPWRQHSSTAFRDVTSGTNVPGPNAATCGGDYLCTGVAGYDGPTGWGTPTGIAGLTPPA